MSKIRFRFRFFYIIGSCSHQSIVKNSIFVRRRYRVAHIYPYLGVYALLYSEYKQVSGNDRTTTRTDTSTPDQTTVRHRKK